MEQVGFVSAPSDSGCDIDLQMAGGEFCGNATMSAAALVAMRSGKTPEQGDPEEVFDNPTQERTKQFLKNYQQ